MSDFGFPALFVGAAPEFHGCVIVLNVTIGRVASQAVAGSVGNVAKVAEQRRLMAFFDF